ncbi:MAG TPA: hypothetical protein VG269_04075 [Tepidisphaeraceae bacterium]|jgi:hypothetical protein|nr:hypothetical protein [Tepidisphaeraceae bacterium]
MNEADLRRAREHPSTFGDQLLHRKCGCYYCLAVFTAAEIRNWCDFNEAAGFRLTPLCPRCAVDSVIEEYEGRPITVEVLNELRADRFE